MDEKNPIMRQHFSQGKGQHNHQGIENGKGQDVIGPDKGHCGRSVVIEGTVV